MLAFGWLFNIVERGGLPMTGLHALLDENVDITDKERCIRCGPKRGYTI